MSVVSPPPAPPTTAPVVSATRREGAAGRRALLLVLAALLVGLGLRVAIGLTDDAPSVDETAYLRSGLSLAAGDGYERDGHAELHFPPLAPALLGATSHLVDDPHTGTVWLTIVAGTVLVGVLTLLAHRLAGRDAAVATAWVAALAPGLATTPAARGAGSEAEYTLLVVGAVYLVVAAARREGTARLARVGGAGLLVGLAYLTRPEGLFVALPLGAAVVVVAARGRRWRAGLVAVAVFALPLLVCVAPYASFLHTHTGRWELTAKTQDASIEAWHAVARSDRRARDEVLYALDDSGLHIEAERTPLTGLARDDPAGYAGILRTNVLALGKNVSGWWLLPLPVWALAVAGAWRSRDRRGIVLLAVVASVPVASALAFFVQPRYLIVTAAVATVLAGIAVPSLPRRARGPTMAVMVVLLAGSSLGAFYGAGGLGHPADHLDQRRAGEWIAAHTDAEDRVMTRSMVAAYYAERPTMAIPYADYDEIMTYARHYGAHYLVVDWYTAARLRPQLADLQHDDHPPGLRLVHEETAEGRTTRIFALDPVPPPPPRGEEAPALGFMGDAT